MSVRAAAVAGRFYPADADELKAQVHALLAAAANRELPVPKAVIAPHAGYVYSGPVAACAYSTLRQAPVGSIERVVLLGPCHRVPLRGLALADVTAFDTPLGTIEIDRSAGDLLQLDCVQVSDSAHELEHSLEVQLPFLTQALAAPFKIVPLVVGETTTAQVRDVLRALWGGPETLIVVSSDLSHFYSYEEASSLDGETSRAIEELTPERIRPEQACGRWVIQGLLEEASERGMRASILDVRNSGDTARASLRHGVGHGSAVPVAVADHEEQLQRRQACFMTLRKDQDLRGCMGSSVARRPLIEDLARNAYAAGFLDPRLGPVEADELGLLDIHISVLSDLEELSFESEEDLLSQVRPGVDGLLLKAGSCRSTLLPAVWNTIRESAKLVDQLKAKAGLKPHCWSDEVRMFRYTTENIPLSGEHPMTALPRVALFAIPAMICTSDLHADVSYVEELVNSGIGAAKVGARKTVRKVYVKGEGQHVRDEVRKGGAVEVGSTIVRLDRLNRYRIDHASKTFTEDKLPPRATTAKADWWQASQGGPAGAGKRVATAADPNRQVKFQTKVLPDTMRVEGILCRRVAAQMRARYYVPGTKEVKRENRYVYQAWMATDFPGYADIQRFEAQREAKTSLPSQIASGGLSEFKDAVEDYDRLDEEMKALEGFPLQSQLKVFTKTSSSSKEKELFRLSRKISSLSHSNLSSSLFDVSQGLRRVEVEAKP